MKVKRKHSKRGRPRDIVSPVQDRNDPDNYPTLIRYLEATGKIKHTTHAQMRMARRMYIRFVNTEKIAADLHMEPAVIDRWALSFGWDEERDRRMFEQFRKVNNVECLYGENLKQRHERLAGSIEQVAERLLQQHANGKIVLSSRDLSTLANTIKSTQDIRTTARGENVDKKQNTIDVNFNMNGTEKIASALLDAFDRPKLANRKTKTIAIGVEDAIGHDIELEADYRISKTSEE